MGVPDREAHVSGSVNEVSLTPVLEEYLEAIYRISPDEAVRPVDIAEALGVRAPTVTATLGRLETRGYIEREGTGVLLTEAGATEAAAILRRHRVAERFLVDYLGFDKSTVHDEACVLEHAMSDRLLDALESLLDDPTTCPHGHPIPQ